jgi:hypothetical protein
MLSFACKRVAKEDQKKIEFSFINNEFQLKIDGEEYIESYKREKPITWMSSPLEKKWKYFGTTSCAGKDYDYEFYHNGDYGYVMADSKELFLDVRPPNPMFQKKDIRFPEISLETIDQILLVETTNYGGRYTKPSTDKKTIEKVVKIINTGSKQEMKGDREFLVALISDAMPYWASWHKVIENDGQYYLEVDAENHYASISRELLEEIAGGSLDNIPWQKK